MSTEIVEKVGVAMRLSVKGEYACLAVIELSKHFGAGPLKIGDIAANAAIPRKYLEQILLSLKNAGYLNSRRGASGGYTLAVHPGKLSVAEVVRLTDGPLAPVHSASKYFYSHTPSEKSKALTKLFREVRDIVARKMESTTFDTLAGRD